MSKTFIFTLSMSISNVSYLQNIFWEIRDLIERWNKIQSESELFFSALLDSSSRLDILNESPSEIGILTVFNNIVDILICDHLNSMEGHVKVLWKA